MSVVEIGREPQSWDPVLLAADLRLRFLAAHARLRQAQLILAHRDYVFPKTLDQCLDGAMIEVWAALDALEGGEEWRAGLDAPMVQTEYHEPVRQIHSRVIRMPTVAPWPEEWERPELWQTVALLALGHTIGEVGERLHVSADAVRSRLHVAYREHGVHNQPALVNLAWSGGLMTQKEVIDFQEPHRRPMRIGRVGGLPPQRWRVLALLAQGQDYRAIAEALGVEFHTAKTHISLLYQDMGMKGFTSAAIVHRGWELGWLPGTGPTFRSQ